MLPKTLLVEVDGSPRAGERLRLARQLAEAFEGHAIARPCMLSALMRYPYAVDVMGEAIGILRDLDQATLEKARAVFHEAAAGSPRLQWEEPAGDAPWSFSQHALYADLLVLGQRDPADPSDAELPSDFISSLLVETGKPALVVPSVGAEVVPFLRVVAIAWKPTREAARAVTAALPWLVRAQRVHLLGFGDAASAALGELKRYLARAGIEAQAHASGGSEDEVGEQILSRCADFDAQLLVMGCYGHSRVREWMLGGATRTLLQSMTLPVLMTA